MRANRLSEEALKNWLQAEAQEDDQAAELALTRLFQELPRFSPQADFADQVLAQAGISSRSVGYALPKWAIAAGLFLAGGLFVMGLPLWLLLIEHLSPSAWISKPVQIWAGWVDHLMLYAPAWRVLVDLWKAAWLVVTSWPVVLVGMSCIMFSLLSCRLLVSSTFFNRGMDYA